MNVKLFVINQVEKVNRGDYTDFLDPYELNLTISILNKNHIKYNIFKLFDDCEKSIVYSNVLRFH